MTEETENLVLRMLREIRDDMNITKSRLEQIEIRMNIAEKQYVQFDKRLSGLTNIIVYTIGQLEEMKQK